MLGQTGFSPADLSIAMRKFGINANPGHPQLVALAAQGITPDTVQAACEEARRARPDEAIGMVYVLGILKRWKADAAKLDLAGATAPKPSGGAWWASDPATLAKGTELGLTPNMGEQMPAFKARIDAALANGGKPPPPASQSRITALPPPEPKRTKPEGLDLKSYLRNTVVPHAQ